jgi:diguanylate cyclase (GGDEF)-like protein
MGYGARSALAIGLTAIYLLYAALLALGKKAEADAVAALLCLGSGVGLFIAARKKSPCQRSWAFFSACALLWAIVYADLSFSERSPAFILLPYAELLSLSAGICLLLALVFRETRGKVHPLSAASILDIAAFCVPLFVALLLVAGKGLPSLSLFVQPEKLPSFFAMAIDASILALVEISIFSLISRGKPPARCLLLAFAFLYCVSDFFLAYGQYQYFPLPRAIMEAARVLSLMASACVALVPERAGEDSLESRLTPTFPITAPVRVARQLALLSPPFTLGIIASPSFQSFIHFGFWLCVYIPLGALFERFSNQSRALDTLSVESSRLSRDLAHDADELSEVRSRLDNIAKRDPITGQLNRKVFLERVDEWIAASPEGECVWMLLMDFDRFKSVNDTYGHDTGDLVLREIGERLSSCLDERCVLARLGGDEFGVVCRRKETEDVQDLIAKMEVSLVDPVRVGDLALRVSLSVGMACFPIDARNRSDLMRDADMAMYEAKSRRLNLASRYDPSLSLRLNRRRAVDMALRKADIEREFEVYYQPQFRIRDRSLVGMEALMRWNSPELGRVGPDEFIGVAEEIGLIVPLSDWIARKALTQISEWNRACGLSLAMSVNVSPLQLDDDRFITKLERLISELRLPSKWIKLEITEGIAMQGEASVIMIFDCLAAMGITVAVDDFGTGYSSMSYLKKYSVDYLKIAKQLIDGITKDEVSAQIVRAIVSMAQALDLRTIAEGVEDEAQLSLLLELGCEEVQGYVLGKPLPAADFKRSFLP